MYLYLDCVPCLLRQTLAAVRMAGGDRSVQHQVVRQVLHVLAETDFAGRTPPDMAQWTHRLIRELTGQGDPYRHIKQCSNEVALSMLPALERRIGQSGDPFAAAVRVALAGNIIDFGANHETDVSLKGIETVVEQAFAAPLNSLALESLRAAASSAQSILYICDNAGEIAFDRLLIEQLGPHKVTAAVRGGPIINDATMEDAVAAGLTGLTTVISTGDDLPGVIVQHCSEPFQNIFQGADLVIAKGQGNFETLSDVNRNVFFLLKAKCTVAADRIGCRQGDYIILESSRMDEGSPRGAPYPDERANHQLLKKEVRQCQVETEQAH